MSNGDRVVHDPSVRLLCAAMVAIGGLICLVFVVSVPFVMSDNITTYKAWVAWWGAWLPAGVFLACAGMLQLVVAGWGVWSWGSAEGAG